MMMLVLQVFAEISLSMHVGGMETRELQRGAGFNLVAMGDMLS